MWESIPTPKLKSEYLGKLLVLFVDPPEQHTVKSYKPEPGTPLRIVRRLNAQDTCNNSRDVAHWGSVRILDVEWNCPHCGTTHRVFVPEAWIAESKVRFVVLRS